MTISIEPAKIVGAEVGDRVAWTNPHDNNRVQYAHIAGLSTEPDYPGCIVIDLEEPREGRRYVRPRTLVLAPKKYAVGDKVFARDADALPNGTTVCDKGLMPLFKISDTWYVIDPDKGTYPLALTGGRTITWLPYAYTNA